MSEVIGAALVEEGRHSKDKEKWVDRSRDVTSEDFDGRVNTPALRNLMLVSRTIIRSQLIDWYDIQ